jgi:hypothetical protein
VPQRQFEFVDKAEFEMASNMIDVVPEVQRAIHTPRPVDDIVAVLRRDRQRDAGGHAALECCQKRRVRVWCVRNEFIAKSELLGRSERRLLNERSQDIGGRGDLVPDDFDT